jgi:DegV family protein with EDD domain
VDAYNQIRPEDELICIMLSSGVSGTYQSACLAKSIVDNDNIYVVDSLTGAYGVKILADEAKKMIEQGKTAAEIVEKLEEMKHHICVYLSVDTLDYLYKGGRLDKTAAFIGNIAKLKPLITVTREGTIGVVSKAIGLNRTIQSMIDVINSIEVDPNYPLYTIQTVGEKNITKLEQKLADANLKVEYRKQLGPVVGSHVGPETFGVIFFGKNLDKIPM